MVSSNILLLALVGGGDDTARKASNGELETLLVSAGALVKA